MIVHQRYALLNTRLVEESLLSLLFAREAGSFLRMSRVSVSRKEDPKEMIETLLKDAAEKAIVHGYEASQIEELLSRFWKLGQGQDTTAIALVQGSRNTVLVISQRELSRASLLGE